MGATLEFFGEQALASIEASVMKGVAEAAFDPFVLTLTRLMSQAQSPPPSSPGEPPHLGRGEDSPTSLVNSVMIWPVPSECAVHVGSLSPYALALELGTDRMEARPVWYNALISILDEMAEELAAKSQEHFEEGMTDARLPDNTNINPLTVESSDIPSYVPGGKDARFSRR